MSRNFLIGAGQLFAIASLLVVPTELKALENCLSSSSQDPNTRCTAKAAFKTQLDIISAIDKNFNDLPSCHDVNSRLDGFLESVQKIARAIRKPNHNQPSTPDLAILDMEASKASGDDQKITSKDVFAMRFSISPVAKQFYFNYLQSQELASGSFDRPVLNFQFELSANPGFNESLDQSKSPNARRIYSYYNETNPYLSIFYPFSFENLYSTKALRQDQESAYYTFIDQSITDSLQTVFDFYDFKSNMLSTILNSFQYQASAERVFRLQKLEEKGLNSRLDISRANVTKTTQSTNLVKSKSDLAQSYDRLMGDFLFPEDFDARIFPILSRGLSTACWGNSPSDSIATALQTNASLTSLRHQIESSKLTRKAIVSQNLPDLTITVSYEFENQWGDINGTGYSNDYNRSDYVVASAFLNWNISNFGQTHANAKSQSNATNSLRNQLIQTLNQLETDLLTNFSDYISSTQNIISLAKASEEATKNYIDALKASQVGILNETDIDNIFNQLTSINSNLVVNIKARNTSAVSIAKLVQAQGFDNLDFNYFLEEWKKVFTK